MNDDTYYNRISHKIANQIKELIKFALQIVIKAQNILNNMMAFFRVCYTSYANALSTVFNS